MSTDRLREAARVLRDLATDATPGPWEAGRTESDAHGLYSTPVFMPDAGCDLIEAEREDDATYIAMMSPPVARTLADWLDYTAKAASAKGRHHSHATRLADLILESTP